MLTKVISGGQTGADRAGLDAALAIGIPTGGWMPLGFRAEDGFHPEFAKKYNIKEHDSKGYPARTEQNIVDACGTIQLAAMFTSPGEKLTTKLTTRYNKPNLHIPIHKPPSIEEIAQWLSKHNISILNIAGNAESRAPGIYKHTKDYLEKIFALVPHI